MNLLERLFLGAVFLVAGAVIVVALGALGVVKVPFVSEEESGRSDGDPNALDFLPPPPPPDDIDEPGLLAELGSFAEKEAGALESGEGGTGSADATAAEGGGEDGAGAGGGRVSGTEEDADAGGRGEKRDPLVDQMKAQVDLEDPGQVLGFLIATFTARGTKLGEEDLQFLFEALGKQEDYGVRNLLLAHLERIGGEQVTDGILAFMEGQKNPAVLARVMGSLGRLKDDGAVRGLVKALTESKNRKLRDIALKHLLGTRSKAATEPLLQALNNSRDPSVKRYALAALSQLGGAAGANAVLRYAGSRDPYERGLGMKSLRDIKSREAVPVLVDTVTRTGNAHLKQQVVRQLGRLRDPRAVPSVSQVAIYGQSRGLRYEALKSLATIGRASAIPALQTIVDTDQNAGMRKSAARAITAIRKQEERRLRQPPPRQPRGPRRR